MPTPIVYHISTFSPTRCGIATYTEDVIDALPNSTSRRVRMQYDTEETVPGFDLVIHMDKPESYHAAAETINASGAAVVSLQHEFGIYGGKDGIYIKYLLDNLTVPVVTTLHTVSEELYLYVQDLVEYIIRKSQAVVVLSDQTANYVSGRYDVARGKLFVIRHGVPVTPFEDPQSLPLRRKLDSPLVFFSMGHLRRSKGYHYALQALARMKPFVPDFKYIILGTYQEQSWDGAETRQELHQLIETLELTDNVVWDERFLSIGEVIDHIKASDIGLVTYTRPEQNSSGVLPLVLSCGRPVIATSFDHALDLQKLVGDCIAIAEINIVKSMLASLLKWTAPGFDLHALMQASYDRTRCFTWDHAGNQYQQIFEQLLLQPARELVSSDEE